MSYRGPLNEALLLLARELRRATAKPFTKAALVDYALEQTRIHGDPPARERQWMNTATALVQRGLLERVVQLPGAHPGAGRLALYDLSAAGQLRTAGVTPRRPPETRDPAAEQRAVLAESRYQVVGNLIFALRTEAGGPFTREAFVSYGLQSASIPEHTPALWGREFDDMLHAGPVIPMKHGTSQAPLYDLRPDVLHELAVQSVIARVKAMRRRGWSNTASQLTT